VLEQEKTQKHYNYLNKILEIPEENKNEPME